MKCGICQIESCSRHSEVGNALATESGFYEAVCSGHLRWVASRPTDKLDTFVDIRIMVNERKVVIVTS